MDEQKPRKGTVVECFGEDAPPEFVPRRWRDGIVAHIRPVPADVDRRLRKRYTGNIKARQLGEQTAEKVIDRGEDLTAERATYALSHFDDYIFVTRSEVIAKAMSEALGEPVRPGVEVDLAGRWSDAVKAVIFQFQPRVAAWVSNEADVLARQDAQVEEEAAGN
jgi:hypothetical protein